jgi:hypothetical protein
MTSEALLRGGALLRTSGRGGMGGIETAHGSTGAHNASPRRAPGSGTTATSTP